MTNDTSLPGFPRPDLPDSHPENYPTLKLRVLRRLGLPDDGGLYLTDAIDPGVLRGYRGVITSESERSLLIEFASLADAVAWAECVTATGRDREMVTLSTQPWSPYQPASIIIQL